MYTAMVIFTAFTIISYIRCGTEKWNKFVFAIFASMLWQFNQHNYSKLHYYLPYGSCYVALPTGNISL